MLKKMLITFMVVSFVIGFTSSIQAKEARKAWSFWEESNEESDQMIDHSAFDEFLKKYVVKSDVNKVLYNQVSDVDKQALQDYIDTLASFKIRNYAKKEQLFYWINLYNAYVIKVILDHYPIASIEEIDLSPEVFLKGPWTQKVLMVEGKKISLDDIRNLIIRPIWPDFKNLYMLHQGHLGGVQIQPFAYTQELFDGFIEIAIADYINHPYAVSINDDNILTLSSFYDWYSEDLERDDVSLLQHLQTYADLSLKEKLNHVKSDLLYEYDFSLNEELTNTTKD